MLVFIAVLLLMTAKFTLYLTVAGIITLLEEKERKEGRLK